VLGPGLGRSPATLAVVVELIETLAVPLVIDGDALYALAREDEGLALLARRPAATVLTPHAGEAGRLLDLDASAIDADRIRAVRGLADSGAVALLKGPASLVAAGDRIVVNRSGGPGLATLGTGDVLAGVVGALLAHGLDPLDAAVLGAYLHGAAGDAAAAALTTVCCTAEDVVAYLPEAVRPLL
jgi:hydroxyethylthiazole kinase-like uncharacterized protein yjeF